MNNINYDFSAFINVFNRMKEHGSATPSDLGTLKNELNGFFKDSKCKDVLYTNNTDKMFFGIKTRRQEMKEKISFVKKITYFLLGLEKIVIVNGLKTII